MEYATWSSPRRISTNEESLSPIPNEIYQEIFSYFEPSEDALPVDCRNTFLRLSEVCQLFRVLAIPHIFKALEFSGSHKTFRSAALCRMINNSTPVALLFATYVKEIEFTHWKENSVANPSQRAFLSLFTRALRRMPNVTTISVKFCSVEETLWKAICKCQKLEKLTFKGCDWSIHHPAPELTTTSLKDFSILEGELTRHGFFSVVDGETTCHGFLNQTYERLDCAWPTFSYLSSKPSWSTLQRLHLRSVGHLQSLYTSLKDMPHLSYLHIDRVEAGSQPLPQLSPSSIPKLRELGCHPLFLAQLSQGRAITSLSLMSYAKADVFTDAFRDDRLPQEIPRSVVSLAAPPDLVFLQKVLKVHPQIEDLAIQRTALKLWPVTGRMFLKNLCVPPSDKAQSQPFSLRRVQVRGHGFFPIHERYDLPVHLEIITMTLVQVFPKLHRVDISDDIVWRKRESGEKKEGSWYASVPAEFRAEVVKRLLSQGQYRDYGNCFGAIL